MKQYVRIKMLKPDQKFTDNSSANQQVIHGSKAQVVELTKFVAHRIYTGELLLQDADLKSVIQSGVKPEDMTIEDLYTYTGVDVGKRMPSKEELVKMAYDKYFKDAPVIDEDSEDPGDESKYDITEDPTKQENGKKPSEEVSNQTE